MEVICKLDDNFKGHQSSITIRVAVMIANTTEVEDTVQSIYEEDFVV